MVNLIGIQQAIWNEISTIPYTVVDYIEFDSIEPPFVQLGNIYIDDESVKNNEGIKCQQYINIYSNYSGKKELLEMVDAVTETMLNIKNIETTYIKDSNLMVKNYTVYVEQGTTTVMIDKDKFSSIFQRTDRNNNKFYHAVLKFNIHIS